MSRKGRASEGGSEFRAVRFDRKKEDDELRVVCGKYPKE